jgi:uncharacterized membrane protein YgdD (TMEM256/DUF423 family)
MSRRLFGVWGGLSGFLAVAAASLGSHHLNLTTELREVFETGARYQLIHAVALMLVAVALERAESRVLRAAGWLFAAGQVFFPLGLYAFALTGHHTWALITPVGGGCYLTAWLALAVGFVRRGAP